MLLSFFRVVYVYFVFGACVGQAPAGFPAFFILCARHVEVGMTAISQISNLHLASLLALDESYSDDPDPAENRNLPSPPERDSTRQGALQRNPEMRLFSSNVFLVLAGTGLLIYLAAHRKKMREIAKTESIDPLLQEDPVQSYSSTPSLTEGSGLPHASEPAWTERVASHPTSPAEPSAAPGSMAASQTSCQELSARAIRGKIREEGKLDSGHLIYVLESTQSSYLHSRILHLLGAYRVREALPMILRDMANPHPWVRLAAAAALVKLRSGLIEDRMMEMAEAQDPLVRATALLVLSRIGGQRCHEVLRMSVWDFEPVVRETAIAAIGRLRVPDTDFELRQGLGDFEERVRARAARVYENRHGIVRARQVRL